MTQKAGEFICNKWSYMREKEKRKPKMIKILPISIRSLESIIRLSTAYAKLRLSKEIDIQDAVQALKLFTKAFYSGYKEIDENFFKEYEGCLKMGREKIH